MKIFTLFFLALAAAGLAGAPTATARTPKPLVLLAGPVQGPGEALGLSLYPNPSHGFVTVQMRQPAGPAYLLRLSNVIGQEIRSVALRPEISFPGLSLNLTDLPGGLYFYSLVVDGKVASTKRLVLQN
ncbi:T9SS type A sorting domain-containing protein [Hymenobacter nivis]|uniref:T9SS C-terminal target domain-containing protein n=1 Tax=Hymenobacter nivis TaxID=1850093 RepID=A0A502H0Q0_9BACT|nr:T9SS type A sorting domain-containing protein [Hymenobacter nivis]TPG67242.1 T9SS C-terminal target domain-containing protein [Hymenobacter nivis]